MAEEYKLELPVPQHFDSIVNAIGTALGNGEVRETRRILEASPSQWCVVTFRYGSDGKTFDVLSPYEKGPVRYPGYRIRGDEITKAVIERVHELLLG